MKDDGPTRNARTGYNPNQLDEVKRQMERADPPVPAERFPSTAQSDLPLNAVKMREEQTIQHTSNTQVPPAPQDLQVVDQRPVHELTIEECRDQQYIIKKQEEFLRQQLQGVAMRLYELEQRIEPVIKKNLEKKQKLARKDAAIA